MFPDSNFYQNVYSHLFVSYQLLPATRKHFSIIFKWCDIFSGFKSTITQWCVTCCGRVNTKAEKGNINFCKVPKSKPWIYKINFQSLYVHSDVWNLHYNIVSSLVKELANNLNTATSHGTLISCFVTFLKCTS